MLVMNCRDRLDELYRSDISDAKKREGKRKIFSEFKEGYAELKKQWGGYTGYDRWFPAEPNNAYLASVATYTQLVPEFQALLEKNNGDLRKFYGAVKEIAKLPQAQRIAQLTER